MFLINRLNKYMPNYWGSKYSRLINIKNYTKNIIYLDYIKNIYSIKNTFKTSNMIKLKNKDKV